MKNEVIANIVGEAVFSSFQNAILKSQEENLLPAGARIPEILFITSYPPRECGIATYSQDLIKALHNKFSDSFSIKVCALESGDSSYTYADEVKYTLNTNDPAKYLEIARAINNDERIGAVVVQHEFGFFEDAGEDAFLPFLYRLIKPVVVVFHTVLPHPDESLKIKVRDIAAVSESVIAMTKRTRMASAGMM